MLTAGLALAASACGGAPKQGNFPTKAELDQIGAVPPPGDVFGKGAVDVERWELAGPLPDAVDGAVTDDQAPWTNLIVAEAAKKPGLVVLSRAMGCVGHEVAAFVAAKSALPASPLLKFMAARCGVPTGAVSTAYVAGEVAEASADAEVLAKWEADVKRDLPGGIGSGARLAGIGFARSGKRAAVAIVSAPRLVHIDNVPLVPADGKVVLRGELLNPAESVRALVTRGRFGFETCVKDVDLQPPKFAIECPVNADDPSARIQVASFPAGRELGETAIDLTVYPAGTPAKAYERAAANAGDFPAGDAALSTALLEKINAARKEAGLGDVRTSAVESQTAAHLAPYYFAAGSGGLDATVADKVALGLLAGWDVDGMVREGHFTSQWAYERDTGALVESAISSPFGRETLLDPAITQIAIGPVVTKEDGAFGAVFGTYAMLDTTGRTDNAAAVIARLAKLRGKIKRPAPEAATEVDTALADVVERVQGGLALDEALSRASSKSLEAISAGGVKVWYVVAPSVEKIEFPSELLATQSLRLGVGVARYKPEGSPWTKLAVFFVMVKEPAPANTARLSSKHAG